MAIRVALLWFALNALLLVVSPSLSEPAGPKISGEISVEIENVVRFRFIRESVFTNRSFEKVGLA